MSFKKVIVSTAAAAALATSAFATAQMDKTGDYLLFPAYYANSADWKTDLRVVNTNTSASVIAKVVIRDARQSDEKVDFMIYLTPGDVWSATIFEDGGNIFINSTDDSMVLGNVTGAEVDGGHTLTFPAAVNGQVLTSGYVEVFGIATNDSFNLEGTWTDGVNTYTDDLSDAPVDKHALYTAFAKAYDDVDNNWQEVGPNDLTGQAVIYADGANGQLAMTYPASAVDFGAIIKTPNNQADVNANYLGVDTKLATMVNALNTTCDAINVLENSFSKTSSYVIHYGDSVIDETAFLATFVSKKYRLDEGAADGCPVWDVFPAKDAAEEEYGYTQSSDFFVELLQTPRDMEENTPEGPQKGEVSGQTVEEVPPVTCDRELCQIVEVARKLREGFKVLDAEKRAELEANSWSDKALKMAAVDFIAAGRIQKATVELIISLPREQRRRVLDTIKGEQSRARLIDWFENS